MKTVLISAAMLGALTATATAAADAPAPGIVQPEAPNGEGGNGLGSVKVASAVSSTFLFVPDTSQSPLVAVGEGGEGGEGGRGRRWRKRQGPYGYRDGYRYSQPGPRYYQPYYGRPRYDRPYYDQPVYRRPRLQFEPY